MTQSTFADSSYVLGSSISYSTWLVFSSNFPSSRYTYLVKLLFNNIRQRSNTSIAIIDKNGNFYSSPSKY